MIPVCHKYSKLVNYFVRFEVWAQIASFAHSLDRVEPKLTRKDEINFDTVGDGATYPVKATSFTRCLYYLKALTLLDISGSAYLIWNPFT